VVVVVVVVVLGVVLGDKVEDSGVVFEPIEAKRFMRKEDMGGGGKERRVPGVLFSKGLRCRMCPGTSGARKNRSIIHG